MIRRKQFDEGLEELRVLLRQMGQHVSGALDHAIVSMKTHNTELAQEIIKNDSTLNQLEENILDVGSRLIIKQQPVAKDLRRIIVAFKISTDLERMGDLASDVAKVTLRMEGQELLKFLVDISQMAEIVQGMIDDSITSYLDENTDLAYQMADQDDKVDALYSKMITELYSFMMNSPSQASQAMLFLLVARYIERIGDHATNVGESTVYLVTGQRPDLNQ